MPGRQVEKGHAIGALVLGLIEVVCGLIIIILSVVVAGKASVSAALSPYWAGIVFAIPGIIGVVVGCTKNHCGMIAFMVLNIIAFVIQGVGAILIGLVIAVWAAIVAEATKNCTKISNTCVCHKDGASFTLHGVDAGDCEVVSTIASMAIGIVVMLVIAAIVTLAASILGCISVCCSKGDSQPGTIIIQQNVPMQQSQQPPAYNPGETVKY